MKTTENQSPFKKEINYALNQLKKTMDLFNEMNDKLENGDIEGAYASALSFADSAEKLTLTARQLPAYTGNPQAQKMCNQIIADNVPVNIGFTPESWFGVVIPTLLPKKQKGSVDYIRDYLYLAMKEFFRGKNPVRYTDCVLIYRHVYRRDRPERRYRDHDNIEINAVTDIIALYVLYDDSPLHCSHYYCSAPGDDNRTEILVVPQKEFGTWLSDANAHKNKALVLLENLS